MRAIVFLVALLQSASLVAQPLLSEEVVSDPFALHRAATPFASPAVAMTKDRSGIAIAWSMPNAGGLERVYVTRLDATAHVSGAVREVPIVAGDNVDAFGPSIAASADGDGFVIGWLQAVHGATTATAAYARADSNLIPAAAAAIADSVQSAIIVRTGSETWLTTAGSLWRMRRDGSIAEPQRITIPIADDMVATPSGVRTVGLQGVIPGYYTSCTCTPLGGGWGIRICPSACQVRTPSSYYLAFTQVNDPANPLTLPFPSNISPRSVVLNDDGRTLMVVWFDGKFGEAGVVRAARILEPQPIWPFSPAVSSGNIVGEYGPADAAPTAPAVAGDGQRFVIVWRTRIGPANHDIHGAIVDQNETVTPLQIASSPADEIDPSIIAIGPGEFLIAYEKYSGLERRIAGKLLTFPARRRAVR